MDRIDHPWGIGVGTPLPPDEDTMKDWIRGFNEKQIKIQEEEAQKKEAQRQKDYIEWFMQQHSAQAIVKQTNPKDAIGMTKVPMHLVSGIVKVYQAIAHYLGNIKYGAWNYRRMGARASVYKAALDRHMDAWWEGEDLDPVDGTPHLANALACINILIECSERGNMVDDRPPKSNYREVVKRMETLMPQINERYKDMKPTHYYDKGENL